MTLVAQNSKLPNSELSVKAEVKLHFAIANIIFKNLTKNHM